MFHGLRNDRKFKTESLNTKNILAAFRGMGDTTAELQKSRMQLMVDGSYFESWTDPSWLMPECALGDCSLAGYMQYVAHETHVCTWCQVHALPHYM